MDEKNFKKHLECLMAMSVDYLAGQLSQTTFVSNLELLMGKMGVRLSYPRCTCPHCTGIPDPYEEKSE
jgi:hypothetical protein